MTCTDAWLEEPLGFYVAGNRHVSKSAQGGLLDDGDTWKKEKNEETEIFEQVVEIMRGTPQRRKIS